MLICLQRRGISTQAGPVSLGRRLLLESVQIQKCQRSEISFSPGGSSDSLRPWGGGVGRLAKGHAGRAQPGWRASQGASCPALVQPSPLKKPAAQEAPTPPPVTLGVQSMKRPRDRKRLGETGEGPLTPRTPILGMLPLHPSALSLSDSKPWCPEGLALHNPSCPVDFTRAGQWGWLTTWESQCDTD